MKQMLFVVAAGMVTLIADVRPSAAREWYPWCAQYASRNITYECLYSSFEQCLATVSGIGGSCIQNWYPPPGEPRRDRRWRPFYR